MKDRISGGELVTIFIACLAAGAVVGPAVDMNWRETPLGDAVVVFPMLVWVAAMIAAPFALLATPLGAIGLLVARHYASEKGLVIWTVGGAVVGSMIGVIHPFCLLSALVEYRASDPTLPDSQRLMTMVVTSGGVAGAVAAWSYRRGWAISSDAVPSQARPSGSHDAA